MSFLGKKFRRSHCENINELVKAANTHDVIQAFKTFAPTICFTRVDKNTFYIDVQVASKHVGHTFKLGEEQEMERKDGSKVRMTYTIEGDNVLHQMIKLPDGKTAHFRREFTDTDCTMTISLEGSEVKGMIWYDNVS
ncbi:fatty acid-binding protein, muscle-like [Pieris brassicae]|uniref:Lipocalin/cytosolic fatty-acid binding domain-containing protein n=1 Tax=Pieris brassicae TaxID=7116 RepID=A0A9P0WU90_PIEBR|nr:fatty acid-binding protein, muscle-like [Pieris brassicae]CAH3831208.1 unnamed protein product [Pieris brassicae]